MSIIRTLGFVENTELQLSKSGMKYIAEESKSFQATAYFKKEFFSPFLIRVPDGLDVISFGVNLNAFTELLGAFLDNELSTMNIVYYHFRNCIVFTYLQTDSGDTSSNRNKQQSSVNDIPDDDDNDDDETAGEIATEYFIQTLQSVEPIDFDVDNPHLLNSIIMNAGDFYSVINDFDRSVDGLEIHITDQRIRVKTVGMLQYRATAKLLFSSGIFNKYESHKASKFIYSFKYFKHMLKAFVLASKMSFQTHVDGMVKIQLMMKTDENQDCAAYMEYFLVPNTRDHESDDDE